MARHNELGKEGEEAAANYLAKNGYIIRRRNWSKRRGGWWLLKLSIHLTCHPKMIIQCVVY
ncbi:MAG: hypothetical protein H6Q17_2045 [Bacteroidetes bacterium]|nr:hypothetical protein [Bacteroidota bacterium]